MVRSTPMATLLGAGDPAAPAPPAERPRLVVLTDISSLTPVLPNPTTASRSSA